MDSMVEKEIADGLADYEAATKVYVLADRMAQGDETPAMLKLADEAIAAIEAWKARRA